MANTGNKVFKVVVYNSEDCATLVCIVYRIGSMERGLVASFRQEVASFGNSQFSIPSERVATFQEELRVKTKVYEVVPEDIRDIEKWIEGKMKDAYGNDTIVTIEELRAEK